MCINHNHRFFKIHFNLGCLGRGLVDIEFYAQRPNIRLEEGKDEFIYEVETPGVSKQNVKVWLSEDRRKLYVVAEEDGRRYREVLTIPPPYEADPDKIEAEYREGLLIIRVKKVKRGFEIKVK